MDARAPTRLSLILWLVALHSLGVAVGLLALSPEQMERFGYSPHQERFFSAQAGVFHLVMVVAYALAAARPRRFIGLVIFSIVAKLLATVFLLVYYFAVDQLTVVLLSGVADFLMALAILWAYRGDLARAASAGCGRDSA